MVVYVDTPSTATQLVAGIYSDASGQPGTLLTQGTTSVLQAGAWNTVSVSPVTLTQGTPYWIAILAPSGTLAFRDSSGCTSISSSQTNLGALPASWTSGQSWPSCPLSAYGLTSSSSQASSTVTTAYQYDALNRHTDLVTRKRRATRIDLDGTIESGR